MISSYITVFNAEKNNFPYIECIQSLIEFGIDEVIVVDGGSDDGTVDFIKEKKWEQVKIFENKWDFDEPGMDGLQKAFARDKVSEMADIVIQMDADEVIHEKDYERLMENIIELKNSKKEMLTMDLGVHTFFGSFNTVRSGFGQTFKTRILKNDDIITHGIMRQFRGMNKEGKIYCNGVGVDDGAGFINRVSFDQINQCFYGANIAEISRLNNKKNKNPNDILLLKTELERDSEKNVYIYHYSWPWIYRKMCNKKRFWDSQWDSLYGEKNLRIEKEINELEIYNEIDTVYMNYEEIYNVNITHPKVMKEYINKCVKIENENRKRLNLEEQIIPLFRGDIID